MQELNIKGDLTSCGDRENLMLIFLFEESMCCFMREPSQTAIQASQTSFQKLLPEIAMCTAWLAVKTPWPPICG